jgi:hypothetical protein
MLIIFKQGRNDSGSNARPLARWLHKISVAATGQTPVSKEDLIMPDKVASKMSSSGASNPAKKMSAPKKGERFRCNQCGMEIQVTGECGCQNPDHAHFTCCNQDMAKA